MTRSSLPSKKLTFGPAYPAAAAAWAGVIAAWCTFVVVTQRPPEPRRLELPEPAPTEAVTVVPRNVQRAVFFDSEVEPRIVETDRLNREAAQRCVDRLRQVFENYQNGIQPFVEDLTSLSTRLGIARRMPGNWWNGDHRIERYVQQKFETHLFSRQKLLGDVSSVLESFRQEVDANQRRLLVSVHASLEVADLPEIQIDSYEPFFGKVARRLRGYSAEQGTTSVYNALIVLIMSEAGSYAAVSVVAGLLARFGSAAAVSAAAGAGVTAGTTAAGAGGGSMLGPVGTAVGLGVGLAVGLVIDWWMTDRFEQEMSKQMADYLRMLEVTILDRPAEGGLTGADQPGLCNALPKLCDRLADAYRDNFYEQIVTVEPAL